MDYMSQAIKQAKLALKHDEVPIGAVIVKDGKIIARGYNKREKEQNALLHAEIVAINKACKKLKSWRLDGCDIYVTLEPCPMCAGAIINARIRKVVFGAFDKQSGYVVSNGDLFKQIVLNHSCDVQGGQEEEKCQKLIKDFFKSKRKK